MFATKEDGLFLREPLRIIISSLRRTPESGDVKAFWIPVFTGMTLSEESLSFENSNYLENNNDRF